MKPRRKTKDTRPKTKVRRPKTRPRRQPASRPRGAHAIPSVLAARRLLAAIEVFLAAAQPTAEPPDARRRLRLAARAQAALKDLYLAPGNPEPVIAHLRDLERFIRLLIADIEGGQ